MLPSLVTWQMSRKRPSWLVTEARKQARSEKRKKQRLVRKAASLTPEDLKRIAILKRCGLWQPSVDGVEAPIAGGETGGASGSGSCNPAATSEPPALPPPASPPSDPEARSGDEAQEDGERGFGISLRQKLAESQRCRGAATHWLSEHSCRGLGGGVGSPRRVENSVYLAILAEPSRRPGPQLQGMAEDLTQSWLPFFDSFVMGAEAAVVSIFWARNLTPTLMICLIYWPRFCAQKVGSPIRVFI